MTTTRADGLAGTRAILVIGMHRSGTSMTAGVLHHLGVSFGSSLMAASVDNPKGFFEHNGIVDLHDELLATLNSRWDDPRPLPSGWATNPCVPAFTERLETILRRDFANQPLWALKDPRMCRLLPLWLPLLRRLGVQTHCLFVTRHPAAVALSLEKREHMDYNQAGILWLQHILQPEAASRSESRLQVDSNRLVESWRPVVAEIGQWLQQDWTNLPEPVAAALASFVTPELRHHGVDDFARFEPQLAALLEKTWRALLSASSPAALSAALDTVGKECESCEGFARTVYGPALERAYRDLQQRQLELKNIRRSWSFRAMRPFRAIGRALRGQRI